MNRLHYTIKKQEPRPAQSGGIGCLSVIGLIFVVMKLLSVEPVASWSWWWVLSPFIFQGVMLVLVLGFLALVFTRGMKP